MSRSPVISAYTTILLLASLLISAKAALLGDWTVCTLSSQCANGCCSGKYSSGVLKCTPVGGYKPTEGCTASSTSLLADWTVCKYSTQCANGCCSGKYSSGVLKCTPVGGYKPTEGCVSKTTTTTAPTTAVKTTVAKVTYYTSYPACCSDPNANQDECVLYNGCKWAGYFYCQANQQPESWVKAQNIVALYDNHDPNGANFSKYCGKQVKLTKGTVSFTATIQDTCGNSDCNNCCQKNSHPTTGLLIDIEHYTALKYFGSNYENIISGDITVQFL